MVLPRGVELPSLIVQVGVVDALDTSLPVGGEERTVCPRLDLHAEHRCKTAVFVGHAIPAHQGLVDGRAPVIDEAALNVEPRENHDVVEHPEVVVTELVHIPFVLDERVLIDLVDDFLYAGVTDTVPVAVDDLRISVTFRVVGHAQRRGEVELSLFEVIADGGVEGQVTVWREGVSGAQSHLIAQTMMLTVAEVERVDDWRETEGGRSVLCCDGCEEILTDGVPENLFQQTLVT